MATATVAQTILSQLGGNRFLAMTGAQCSADDRALIVRLPQRKVVVIELLPTDTYRVKFGLRATVKAIFQGKPAVTWKADSDGVDADQLRDEFTRMTGLATSL